MHQGNWKCSTCGGAITELPFVPRSESGLTCRTCYAKGKGSTARTSTPTPVMDTAGEPLDIPDYAELAGEPSPDDGFPDAVPMSSEKPKIQGSWQCAGCGGEITSLPFTPRDTRNLKCLDCYKRSKG